VLKPGFFNMKVDPLNRSRIYFHLGYGAGAGAGIDAGDVAQVEEAMNAVRDEYFMNRIKEQLDICDDAWDSARATKTGFRFDIRENYAGDINRAIVRDSSKSLRIWEENYRREADALARLLWVPNYNREGMERYRFERAAGAFVRALPGVADTAISSRRLQFEQLAGSFGY
jgi:hypothetical protein